MSPTATLAIRDLARDLKVSVKTIRRLNKSGHIPRPAQLNRSFRWLHSEIRLWIELGMPARSEFERIKAERRVLA